MLHSLGPALTLGLALAGSFAWWQRVPLQNVILAAALICVWSILWILSGILGTVHGAFVPLVLAIIFSSRILAARCLRRYRYALHYGLWLHALATLLGTIAVGATIIGSGQSVLIFRVGLAGLIFVLFPLLITLPCFLDKKNCDLRQEIPSPIWPAGIWCGTLAVAFLH